MTAEPTVGAHEGSLLRTKLYIPPLQPDVQRVLRPRLVERMDAGLHAGHKLTLVSAPAGFGKTTLLSEWIQTMATTAPRTAIAWLSLDESDNDPSSFLVYVIAALQTIETGIGRGALDLLRAAQPAPPSETVLTSLINQLAAHPDPILLVLDDYHLIAAQPVHDALGFLLRHLPPQMHLVIATREDPPLPVARLRARGQLTELRAAELRFALSEAAAFLNNVMGLDLSESDVAALERRTEGWIAGLQLAALALQGATLQGRADVAAFIQSFTGSHHFVLDYLVQEVLEQQPERIQTFLLSTAILDRLTGPLCDAVRGGCAEASFLPGEKAPCSQTDGQEILHTLQHANLFIVPLDEEQRWYRYHHLFADLLRRRLRHRYPDRVQALHIRASVWYEQHGFPDQAIEHALRAGDLERMARLIEAHVDVLWQRGEHTKLRSWMAALPAELVLARPHLCILHAWHLFTSGQQDAAEQVLRSTESVVGGDGPTQAPQQRATDVEVMMVRGRASAIRAFLASHRGDVQATVQHARRALGALPAQDLTWRATATVALGDAHSFQGDLAAAQQARQEALEISRSAGNTYMALISSMKLAATMRQQGRLAEVVALCAQQMQLASDSGLAQTIIAGWLLAIWGETLAELGDLDGALRHARKGAELVRQGADVAMIGWCHLCLVRVLFSAGNASGAQEVLEQTERMTDKFHVPPWITNQLAAWQVRIWLAQGKLEAAAQWVQDRGLTASVEPVYIREVEVVALARVLVAQERWAESAVVLQRLRARAETRGHMSRAIEALALCALSLQAQGQPDRAVHVLQEALTLAEPSGYVRTFVDEGPPMAHLLAEVRRKGTAVAYVTRILGAVETIDDGRRRTTDEGRPTIPREAPSGALSAVHGPSSALIEPLSEREMEVLHLIAAGLTNREIASRLFLSLNTVKVHNRNIYGKLAVHNRTQAVARARDLGILPLT